MTSVRGEGYHKAKNGKFEAYIPNGKGGHDYVGTFATAEESLDVRRTTLLMRGRASTRTTLRQWGEAYLKLVAHHRSIVSETNTWNSVICDAPFIDDALEDLTAPQLFKYATTVLPRQPKKQSVLKNGKRSLKKTGSTISRKYAQNAMTILVQCLERAKNEGLLQSNPAEGITVERDREQIDGLISYLSAADVERLLSCWECAAGEAHPISDIRQLVKCPHMPIEKRVAFTLAVHQCPRAGELAAMDWSLVDLSRKVWHVAKSWDGPTKNGKRRTQGLLPRSIRALDVWHELQGKPRDGLLFPSPRKGKKRDEPGRYAKGYDWSWSDHKNNAGQDRPGWWRRAGIETRVRFHDMRDTAATHLLSGTWGYKWPIKEVSEHLGHSSVAITEQRYAHLTTDAKVATASRTESDRRYKDGDQHGEGVFGTATKTPSFEGSGGRTRTYDQSVNSLYRIEGFQQVESNFPRVVPVSSRVELATQWLEQVADETCSIERAVELAEIVLADDVYRLANEVLALGPHTVERATELARRIAESDVELQSLALPYERRPQERTRPLHRRR